MGAPRASRGGGEALAVLGGPRAVTVRPPEGDGSDPLLLREALAALDGWGWDWRRASLWGGGPIGELEAWFRSFLGVRHALALSSGTAALHAALLACGVRRGAEVIVSAYDWGAAAAAVLAAGAEPVFADIDPRTYTLDPASVAERITGRTAAVVVTHILGHPADMDRLLALARRQGLRVVEDCAQALGARYRGRPVGSMGDAGCFSLGPGKPLAAGEGGVLVTDSDDLFERAVRSTQHPLRQQREGVEPNHFALNYRMHPLAAALALPQLGSLPERLAERRRAAERLTRALEGLAGIRPVFVAEGCTHAFYRYSPTYVEDEWGGLPRGAVVEALSAEGVPIAEGPVGVPLPGRLAGRGARPRGRDCPRARRRCASEELLLACPGRVTDGLGEWLAQVREGVAKVHRRRGDLGSRSPEARVAASPDVDFAAGGRRQPTGVPYPDSPAGDPEDLRPAPGGAGDDEG